MKVYTARQPIFNRKGHVVAYELLFRDGPENFFPKVDPHEATSKLLVRTHLSQGIDSVTGGKPALINFTEQCLLKGLPFMVPNKKVMIEVLEDVNPTDDVFEVFKSLFHNGYHIALDDFIYRPEWERFFKYIKMIKFDVKQTPLSDIGPIIEQIKAGKQKIKLLAEKVETKDDVTQAAKMGFDYFQGYFFCKPEITAKQEVDSSKHVLILLYRELMKPELNVKNVTECFEQDLNLTYKLLRFINSGILPLTEEISSIKQALIYLGEKETRKLIALVTTSVYSFDKPKELIRTAIIRARFCEIITKKINPALFEAAFLMGLLSLIDAILDLPLPQILAQLPLSAEIEAALVGEKETQLKIVLNTVTLYESGSWHLTTKEAAKLGVSYEQLAEAYQESIEWMQAYEQQS